MRSSRAIAIAVASVVMSVTGVSAHRLDELLQAARVDITLDRVNLELSLTPGAAVADRVIGAIDRNRDGAVSADEERAFAAEVIDALRLDVDGHALEGAAVTATFPPIEALRTGDGVIQLRTSAALPPLADGAHRIGLTNNYRRDISVYLANALVPDSDRIAITAQGRDGDQSELTIDYTVRGQTSGTQPYWLLGMVGCVAVVAGRLLNRRTGETGGLGVF